MRCGKDEQIMNVQWRRNDEPGISTIPVMGPFSKGFIQWVGCFS